MPSCRFCQSNFHLSPSGESFQLVCLTLWRWWQLIYGGGCRLRTTQYKGHARVGILRPRLVLCSVLVLSQKPCPLRNRVCLMSDSTLDPRHICVRFSLLCPARWQYYQRVSIYVKNGKRRHVTWCNCVCLASLDLLESLCARVRGKASLPESKPARLVVIVHPGEPCPLES